MEAADPAIPANAAHRRPTAAELAIPLVGAKLARLDTLVSPALLPSAATLRGIRELVEDPAFRRLAKAAKGGSAPGLGSAARKLSWLFRDRDAAWKSRREGIIALGVSGAFGGVTGTFASALTFAAALTPTLAVLTLVPMSLGIVWVALSLRAARRLEEERHLYEQLARAMASIAEDLDND